jgi:hypothetical protein
VTRILQFQLLADLQKIGKKFVQMPRKKSPRQIYNIPLKFCSSYRHSQPCEKCRNSHKIGLFLLTYKVV